MDNTTLSAGSRPVPAGSPAYKFDLGSEPLLHRNGIAAAVQELTGLPDRPHISAVGRWITRGMRGIKLPTLVVGGRRYTTSGAIRWWLDATSTASTAAAPGTATAPLTPTQRRALERAGLASEVR